MARSHSNSAMQMKAVSSVPLSRLEQVCSRVPIPSDPYIDHGHVYRVHTFNGHNAGNISSTGPYSELLRDVSSCNVGNFDTSTGLHRPKSDSFMCPVASKRRLSGLMSLLQEEELRCGGFLSATL